MSINVMNRVWETSQHKGGALNLMLAIADFADDDGNAFPGVPRLAKKIRMTERNTQLLLRKLEESGELMIKEGAGPRGTNRYRIILDQLGKKPIKKATAPDEKNSPPKSLRGEKTSGEGVKNLQGSEREGGESQITRSIMDPPVNDPPSSAIAENATAVADGGDGGSPLADWLKREFVIITAERFSAYPDAATRAYVQRLHDSGANAAMIAADLAKPGTRRNARKHPATAGPNPPAAPRQRYAPPTLDRAGAMAVAHRSATRCPGAGPAGGRPG
jgi:hypothetical protein